MIEYLEQMVFTRLKASFSATIKAKYPKLKFTTDGNQTSNETYFPSVYFLALSSPETSLDLERGRINGVRADYQIEVSDNVSQSNARAVMNEVVRVMKGMRFYVSTMPTPADVNGVYRLVVRFRRNIDEDDVL